MITVNSDGSALSNDFISKLNSDSRNFKARFLIEGSVLSCDIKKVSIGKGSGKGVCPGNLYVPYFDAQVMGCNTDLYGTDIELQIGLVLGESEEYLTVGEFTVIRENRSMGQTEISAVGFLRSKCSDVITINAGTGISSAISQISTATGIDISLKGLAASGTIPKALSVSCRDALGEIAALLGGFVTEDNSGGIVIVKYGYGVLALEVNGDRMLTPPKANSNDYEVTGIKVVVSRESVDEDGQTIPEVSYSNGIPNITYETANMTQTQFNTVVQNIVGYGFRPAVIDLSLGDPRLEAWDSLSVTTPDGDEYIVPCLEIVNEFHGGLETKIDASVISDAENETMAKGPYAQAMDDIIAKMISANDAILKRATIGQLNAETAIMNKVIIGTGSASDFTAAKLTFMTACGQIFSAEQLTALSAAFDTATAGTITADNIDAARAVFRNAIAGSFNAGEIIAASAEFRKAVVQELFVQKLNADYAEINFANVTTEAVKNLFVNVGMIENATIHEGRITGTLSGVTVVADLIQANAIVTGDLIVQDAENEGTYYKINPTASSLTIDELEALEYDKYVSGQYIVAKSITADQIAVTELAAFGATIAGLQLENGKIYSAGKSTATSSAAGFYLDSQGQFSSGDGNNYIRSWYDTNDDKWKVEIRTDELNFSSGESVSTVISSAANKAETAIALAEENRDAIRVSGLSLEAFREEIRLAVAYLSNNTKIFKGEALEDYQSEEVPTLTGYPTVPEFYVYPICSTTLYCSDQLICGTNHFADHINEICLNTTYNDFYQFRYDSTEQIYNWERMTAAEVETLSNKYAYISVDEDGIYIKASRNNQSSELTISSGGITPSRIFCC